MQFFTILVGVVFFFQFGYSIEVETLAGGWSTVDPKSSDVKAAAKFAVQKTYPEIAAEFKVVSAKKQVVAGMNYDLIVDVTTPDENCAVNHFVVWDRFGTKTLTHQDLPEGKRCEHSA